MEELSLRSSKCRGGRTDESGSGVPPLKYCDKETKGVQTSVSGRREKDPIHYMESRRFAAHLDDDEESLDKAAGRRFYITLDCLTQASVAATAQC
jgi:hypothetical protein